MSLTRLQRLITTRRTQKKPNIWQGIAPSRGFSFYILIKERKNSLCIRVSDQLDILDSHTKRIGRTVFSIGCMVNALMTEKNIEESDAEEISVLITENESLIADMDVWVNKRIVS